MLKDVVTDSKKQYRADIASILSTRIINYTILQANNKKIVKDFVTRVGEIIKSEVLTSDISYVIARQVYNADTKAFASLLQDKDVVKYVINK
jgi:hypothetical protein